MENSEIADKLREIADILEIQGGNLFRINAYRRAAESIEALTEDIDQIYKRGQREELEKVPGVGVSIAQKIEELLKTGRLKELKKMEKKVPAGLVEMMEVEGVGPKLVQFVYKKFKVKSIDQLEKLVKAQKLRGLKGFGAKTEENILRGIKLFRKHGQRALLGRVVPQAESIIQALKRSGLCQQIEVAGSIRRRRETIGDIDILVTSKKPEQVMELFISLPDVAEIEAKGRTKSMVILKSGLGADVRVVDPICFGAALLYFTGSKTHNISLRKRAIERKLKINEYGVFKVRDNKRIASKTEEEVYRAVGLPWMEPELREDQGEIEAAEKGTLPKLVKLKDIKGDLHMHTKWSDGANSIEEMVKEAISRGYQYIAITDHASPLGILKGIAGKKVLAQLKEIARLKKKYQRKIAILSGAEVDILPSGKLYLPDNILKKLDLVIAAVHSKMKMTETEMTKRILSAVHHPDVDIIAHPTGRILGRREPYPLDLDEIMDEAKKTGTILEVNAFWTRLDLDDINCRKAKEKGIKIAISTDAHNLLQLDLIRWGISQARRGWLEKKDVVNALPLAKLKKLLGM